MPQKEPLNQVEGNNILKTYLTNERYKTAKNQVAGAK